jgi:hypothetical protein
MRKLWKIQGFGEILVRRIPAAFGIRDGAIRM